MNKSNYFNMSKCPSGNVQMFSHIFVFAPLPYFVFFLCIERNKGDCKTVINEGVYLYGVSLVMFDHLSAP